MDIDVALTAYPRSIERFEYFTQVVGSLYRNLEYNLGNLFFKAGIETRVPQKLLEMTYNYCEHRGIQIIPNLYEPSLPLNLNHMKPYCTSDFTLYVQDDFCLRKPLNLTQDVAWMADHRDFSMLRYRFNRVLKEERHEIEPVNDASKPWDAPDQDQLVEIDPKTQNLYSDHPHLKRWNFHDFTGPFDEKQGNAGAEHAMNLRVKELCAPGSAFQHRVAGRGNGREFFLHIGTVSAMPEKWIEHHGNTATHATQAE